MDLLMSLPCSSVPSSDTQAYAVLTMLLDGIHSTSELTIGLGGKSPRSALQSLSNEDCDYWLIHNIGIESSSEGRYQIDPRHLSGNSKLDQQARSERLLDLLTERKDTKLEAVKHLPYAMERWREAESLFGPQLQLPLPENNKTA